MKSVESIFFLSEFISRFVPKSRNPEKLYENFVATFNEMAEESQRDTAHHGPYFNYDQRRGKFELIFPRHCMVPEPNSEFEHLMFSYHGGKFIKKGDAKLNAEKLVIWVKVENSRDLVEKMHDMYLSILANLQNTVRRLVENLSRNNPEHVRIQGDIVVLSTIMGDYEIDIVNDVEAIPYLLFNLGTGALKRTKDDWELLVQAQDRLLALLRYCQKHEPTIFEELKSGYIYASGGASMWDDHGLKDLIYNYTVAEEILDLPEDEAERLKNEFEVWAHENITVEHFADTFDDEEFMFAVEKGWDLLDMAKDYFIEVWVEKRRSE